MKSKKTLLFELSKEPHTIPCAEVLACLDAETTTYSVIDSNENVLCVEVSTDDALIDTLARRLAFTFVIDEVLFSCNASLPAIAQGAEDHPLRQTGSIAIRCKNRSSALDSNQVIDRLGDFYTKNRKVNLTNPENELRAVITEKTAYIGVKKAEINTSGFQQRRGHLRPFLSPVTMHPKIARALVNLSSVKKNEVLLDPFCGTGGILIEAALLGAKVIGSDIEKNMIEGCRKNLEYYQVKDFQLFCSDIGEIKQQVHSVDAIVTDFPYAKSTTTKGEQLQQLYTRGFDNISLLLKKNKCVVIGLSNKELIPIGENYLSLLDVFQIRVHKSMTRYFVVYKK